MNKLSISDDDICATCKFCVYNVGEMSECKKQKRNKWPAVRWNGYAVSCPEYNKIDHPEQNWQLS